MPNGHFRVALRLASALLIATSVLILFPAAAHATCSSPANAIEAENCLSGTPQSQWDISGAGDPSIQGFATDISFNAGQTVSFKINTTATSYHLDIYRMGYYQGNGARLIVGKALNNPILPSVTLPQTQPACITDAPTNLVDCGNWAVSASWAVPATAVSGIYFAQLVRDDTVGSSHIVFIVRNDSSTSAVLFQTSDETWQAYNDFGGHSLYGPTGVFNNSQRAYKVSYNRPFHTRSLEPASWVFYAEYPMVRWLEANGYDVTYFTSLDAARSGSVILKHKLYLSAGHDEYWSGAKRTNIEAARAAGVNLGFFTGSGGFWKTRWENSIDGTSTAYRTLVSYRETIREAKLDPLDPPTWTGTWRDPTFSPPADGGKPENAVTGTLFRVYGCGVDNTDLSVQVPAADGKMRFWRGSAIANQTTGQTFTLPIGTLGYEWDVDADNGFRPAGLFPLSTATYNLTTDYLIDYGATYGAGAATHHSTLYKASSKALVFGAGTVQWSWGLDNHHDTYCGSGPYVTDPNMQQATVNLFADMGVQPATLQAGLLAASASADTTAPVSTIISPASGAKLEPGSVVTIQGTAADSGGGVVGGVEVSTDGGATWHPANGRESWSYAWTVSGTGSVTLRSRAVDDSGNLETPAAGVTTTIAPPSCPCTIWPSTATPGTLDSGDASAYELGVKFTADFTGTVTGIRFYKSAANTGTHIGNLWSAAGGLLGSATFTGESASGWQQVSFTTPVAVTANTVYVASYSTTVGHYSFDSNYFATTGVDNPPLHALQNGVSGGNGLFVATPGVFPSNSFNSGNYWVDLVYAPTSTVTLVSIAVAPVDPTLQIAGTQPFTATGTYSDGTKADITSQVTWTSSNTGVASITSAGLATAVAGGPANIIATLGIASGNTTVTVQAVPLAITTTTLPNDAVNVPYSATLAATGGVRPYTWSLATGSLPTGLTLSPAGQISGTPLSAGTNTLTVQVRDSGSQEGGVNPPQTATQSLSITTGATTGSTIWPSTAVPTTPDAGDAAAVELGVRFRADISGLITGIRFYKSATNTGTHVGNLWSNTGSLLATGTFANETASGWQEVSLLTPVLITANTVYVASYHTTVGHYSADSAYLATTGVDNPPLHALQNGVSGANGVFTYDTAAGCTPSVQPCFPVSSFNSANYWVDVVFKDTFAISGTISGGGGNGATVTASLGAITVATATANASGAYSLIGLGNGTYTVAVTNAGFTFVPASQSATINNSDATANFSSLYSISGTVGGTGGNGATVTLSGAASATVTANASGAYSFTGLVNGAYTVTPTHTGFTLSPASQAVTINNANATANFFTLFSLSGTISPAPAGVGATVTVTGTTTAAATADSNGNYSFPALPNGAYTVTPARPGFGFTPASQAVSSNGAAVTGVNFTAAVSITVDATVSKDSSTASNSIISPTFSTTAGNELLLAFVASDANVNTSNMTVTGVTGAGLTWALVQRTNTQMGTAEIWRAFAPTTLSNVSVTATLSQTVGASMTVVSFSGANPSGTNGSGAIGATGTGNANPGAPTASLVTTQNNSWVFGVGSDWDNATARTLGPNQTMVHQYLGPSGYALWVQRQNIATPLKGTTVTINDTAPTTDRYDLSICEILPAPAPWVLSGTISGGGAGATVTLSGAASATVTADASGNYSFTGLNNGAYTVTPSSTSFKYTPASQPVTINGANNTGVNFAGVAAYSISGNISPAAMGSGATVALSGAATATTTADASGNYTFTGLLNGAYTVTPSKTGFTFTPVNQAATINNANVTALNFSTVTYSISGTISGTGGIGATVTVTGPFSASATADASGNYTVTGLANGAYKVTPSNAGFAFTPPNQSVTVASANVTAVNFGSTVTYSISGTISGTGGNAATVNLTGASTATVTADASGNYTFTGLLNGAYTVTPSKTGMTYAPASQPATINNANVTALNFSTVTYSISGTISGTGGNAATVNLTGTSTATVTADASGNFTFSGLVNGAYTVTPSKTGFNFTPASQPATINSANVTALNFSTVTYSISGTISGPGGNGATVNLTGAATATVTADASGNYTFSGLANGAYTVAPSKTGVTYTPASQPATINNANVTALNFSTVTYSISGTISGPGGNAATVNLTGASTATVTADASGNYTFSGLVNGAYTVTPSKTGMTYTPASQPATVNSANVTALNFTTVTYSISGTISGTGGNAATVNLTGTATATVTADASGNYSFTGLLNGPYTVTPSKSGFTFTPVNAAVTVSGANVAAVNFTAQAAGGVTLAIDASVSTDNNSAATSITSPLFSTSLGNELLLAFIASDGNTAGITVTGVANATGGTLTWTLVRRTNTQMGTAEIWRAFSATTLSGASVKATLSQSVAASITVVAFSGVDTSGTGGAGAIGAVGGSNAASGAATASLTTTRNNSWVLGVGNDWDNAIARTLGPNQTMVHQFMPSAGDTLWMQRQNAATPLSGTSVTINDTAPTTDRYNLSLVEVLPATISGSSISGTITNGSGATVTLSGTASATTTADTSGNYSFTGLANGPYTVTPSKSGFSFTPPSQNVTINSANLTGVNFSAVTYSISGTISGTGGNGAAVNLTGTSTASVTADASGNYSFTGLLNGPYTVTPSKSGFTFTPVNAAVTVSGANVAGVNFTAQTAVGGTLAIDASVSADNNSAATSITSPLFSTSVGNELLLAFIASDGNTAGITVTGVANATGGTLTWTLVRRTNTQMGTAEIWRAFSATTLSGASVKATLSQSVAASITVVTFSGVDTSGTGGSGAIGAVGGSNAASGAPTASLTTTRNNSWVFGVGTDWDKATARTLGANQTMVHQYLAPIGDTYWVQRQTATTPASGTVVTINDTAPTADRYNLSLCEILPAP